MELTVIDIMNYISRDEIVAVFLEDDPTSADFEEALFYSERKYFESSEHYDDLKGMIVNSFATRKSEEGSPVFCIGIVC